MQLIIACVIKCKCFSGLNIGTLLLRVKEYYFFTGSPIIISIVFLFQQLSLG